MLRSSSDSLLSSPDSRSSPNSSNISEVSDIGRERSICTPSSLAKQGHWLCSASYQICLFFSQLECCWASYFSGVSASPSCEMGWRTLSTVSGAMSQPPCLGGGGEGCFRLLSVSEKGSLVVWPEATLSSGCELILLPVLTWEASTTYTGFALGAISSARSSLGLRTTGPHRFQELSPAICSHGT